MTKFSNSLKKIMVWCWATLPRRIVSSLVIAGLLLSSFWFLLLRPQPVEAGWFDQDWLYRRAIVITNNTTAETDVYVTVSIDTSDTGKNQGDCGDLRFTKLDGTLLKYFVSSGCGTGSTSVNVLFDTLIAGAQTLYSYYGNPSATNGFEGTDFSTVASDYSVGSIGSEEKGTGPVLWMKFDEGYGTTAYDFSEQGNDGTITNATWTMDGKFNRALSFDGSGDYVDAGVSGLSTTTGTVCTWAKPTGGWDSGESADDYIVEYGSAGDDRIVLYFNDDGAIRFLLIGATTEFAYTTATSWNEQWYYICGTYDASTIQLYIDSVAQNSDTGTSLSSITTNTIGGDQLGGAGQDFNGTIDEVKVYPYARSAAQIKRDYNQGFGARMGGEYTLPSGLVGYWDFDEGSGSTTYDTSANSNDGTITNASWKGAADCKYGNCLDFDGTGDYVDVGDDDSLTNTNFSASFWINQRSLTAYQVIAGKGVTNGQREWRLDVSYTPDANDGKLRFLLGGSTGSWAVTTYYSNTALTTNAWYHIVITYNGTTQVIYINGTEDSNNSTTQTLKNGNENLRIGESGEGDKFFNGRIDHVMIFDRALTQKEIVELMMGTRPAITERTSSPGATVGYWKFDEGFGATAQDSSGRDNDGTITNATWTMDGKYGRALSFDGSGDYVDLGDVTFLDGATATTFSAWIKPAALNANHAVLRKWYASGQSYAFGIDNTNNDELELVVKDSSDNVLNVRTTTANLVTGNWYHIAGVWEGGNTASIYVNGVSYALTTDTSGNPSDIKNTAERLAIGARYNGGSPDLYFNGTIDEVKIYPFALTADEVKLEYNRGKAVQMGAVSTASDGTTPSYSQSRAYCPPGFTGTCDPPVGEWKMDEKADDTCTGGTNDVCDTSANSNDGAISGNPVWKGAADCKYGNCLYFDGDGDYVEVPDSASLNPTTALTMEAWIKSTGNDEEDGRIVGKRTASAAYEMLLITASGKINVYILTSLGGVTIGSAKRVDDGMWHHIAVTRDEAVLKIYIDGVLDRTGVVNTGSVANTGKLVIGRYSPSAIRYFNGPIDHVMIFDYAMTQEQIAWLYNKGKPVGHWKFNEGEASTATDSSENNNTGTLTNMEVADWISGKYSSGLDFDGSDEYVDVGDTSQTLIKAVSLWVKPDAVNVTEEPLDLNGTGYVKITNGAVTGEGFTSPTIYINGIVASTVTTSWNHIVITTGTGINASDLDIGRLNTTYFDGKIDEVKIYNYELTSQQVKLDYNQGAALRFGD